MLSKNFNFWSSPPGWAALGLIGAVSYFLFMEHRQHLFEYLPFLIILACPLMHAFMHHTHGHNQPDEDKENKTERDDYRHSTKETKRQQRKQTHRGEE